MQTMHTHALNSQDKKLPTHLLVLVHGLNGHFTQMNYFEKRINQVYNGDIIVLKSACNSTGFFSTADGIDVGGTRLCAEIKQIIKEYPSLVDFSILGNSLGGLYSRYCIGHLFSGPDPINLKPKLFITTVSPHLGVRETLGYYQSFGLGLIFRLYSDFHRTASQLMLSDVTLSNKPLLVEMSEPDSVYMNSLALFEDRILFANYLYDYLVPYCTSAIVPYLPTHHATESGKDFSSKYPHVVGLHIDPQDMDIESAADGQPSFFAKDSLESRMIINLRKLSWKRVDILFTEGPEIEPHECVIVGNGREEGRDVVDYMIEEFFLRCHEGVFVEALEKKVEDFVFEDAKPIIVKAVRVSVQYRHALALICLFSVVFALRYLFSN
eukprot:TRINITY_DN3887_c0_g1_i2.p1 TRINITY_DN3887_c0_g1~~TRINITY_DN3887_c0_g1_i2.p1  ORF type:complete len:381 (-),score=53.73 TRINITY_DN3887_c0_g1_i2:170-1312(-)